MVGGCRGSKLRGLQANSKRVSESFIKSLSPSIGKALIYLSRVKGQYKGEVDKDGKACGYGKLKVMHFEYEGTWFANKEHGLMKVCKCFDPLSNVCLDSRTGGGKWRESDDSDMEMPVHETTTWEEYRNGKDFGRGTSFSE